MKVAFEACRSDVWANAIRCTFFWSSRGVVFFFHFRAFFCFFLMYLHMKTQNTLRERGKAQMAYICKRLSE